MQGVEADLYVTGEFGHHHILDALSCSRSVIVCNHSNTERGYLKVLKSNLEKQLAEGYEFIISKVDKDPLVVFSYVYLVTNIITFICDKTTNSNWINHDDVFLFYLHL